MEAKMRKTRLGRGANERETERSLDPDSTNDLHRVPESIRNDERGKVDMEGKQQG